MYPYINIFGKVFTSYGIMLIIGYFAGLIVIIKRAKIFNYDKSEVFVSYVLAGFGALIGGKLFYVIQGIPQFVELNSTKGITFYEYFMNSGLVFYGGFIGCIGFIAIACLIFKFKFWHLTDILLPALPLAQAIGRVGCFLVGCCYGIPYKYGFDMSNSPFIDTHELLLPIQLIESISVACLFVVIMIYGKKQRPAGKLLGIYMIGYGIIRFITEFYRGDLIRGIYGSFSISQWISMGILIIGLLLFFHLKIFNIDTAVVE